MFHSSVGALLHLTICNNTMIANIMLAIYYNVLS